MAKRKPSNTVQLKVRMREALRRLIEHHAQKNDRTLNDEIVRRLEKSFTQEDLEDAMTRVLDAAFVRLGHKPATPSMEDK